MSKYRYYILAAVISVTGAIYGLTKMTSLAIINSTIDSTPIGSSTPSTGVFTSTSIGSGFSQFSAVPNGPTPARRGMTWGSDPAGDVSLWFNSAETGAGYFFKEGSTNTTIFSVTSSGINAMNGGRTAGTVVRNPTLSGNPIFTGTPTFGSASFGGTASATHFVGSFDGVVGNTAPATGTFTNVIATLGLSGTLTGNVIGNVSGNAGTASAFQATPSPCPSGTGFYRPVIGIDASGNPTCGPLHEFVTLATGMCTTPGGTSTSCSNTVTWPLAFTDTNYAPVCQGGNPSDPARTVLNMGPISSASSITVNTQA